MVQWLRLSNTGGMGSIPGQRTKMSHTKHGKKRRRRGKASMSSVLVKETGEFS